MLGASMSFSRPSERAGLALIATTGLASAVSTLCLLAYITWYAFMTRNKSSPFALGVRAFTMSSMGCYLISLLLCDFLQGSAFLINYHWADIGRMDVGALCTAQGAISEVGDLGAAVWSLAISFHTFWLLFLVRKPHRMAAPIVISIGWIMLIVLPILGPRVIETPKKGPFYGLSGAWCWIGHSYSTARLLYLYVWVFLALGTSVVIYTLIYLRFASFIIVGESGRLAFNFRQRALSRNTGNMPTGTRTRRTSTTSIAGCFDWAKDSKDFTSSGTGSSSEPTTPNSSSAPVGKHLKQVARRLMWYPIVYAFVVLPVSVCRMGVLAGWTPPFGLYVFAGICFSASGLTNTLLFILTRHSLIRQVAEIKGTRIHITTQRITIRDEPSGMELNEIEATSPETPKIAFYDGADVTEEGYPDTKDRGLAIVGFRNVFEEERKPGFHITVVGQ
ncbi:hypothetical protein M422DRAFT_210174 [Sphaerobolus stellatus SS14]|uniref:Glucose receptor Git3 N-terminal domain-containing protein n=1 Tax=Sphaerobolus stellatus (strain SS14) TaxID=990650 RepID=A0A0C9UA05_SPHS4|nr:hypothetical protein M422DRAFT_210174 [Sphaerobolus stellatus SS14]